jgi:hypothetical protein
LSGNKIERSSANKENLARSSSIGFNDWKDSNSPAIAKALKAMKEKS